MKKLIVYTLAFFTSIGAFAQRNLNDDFFTQSYNYYNPSHSLTNRLEGDVSSVTSLNTLIGITPNNNQSKAQLNNFFQHTSRFSNFMIMVHFVQQPYSFTTNSELALGFGYTLPIADNHAITFALRGDFSFYNLKKLKYESYLPNLKKIKAMADMDLGVSYHYKGLDMGLSGKHIFAARYKPDDVLLQNQRDMYFHTGYNFRIGEKVELKPSVFLTPINYMNTLVALELGLFHQFYVQYAFRLNELRHQYVFEYRNQMEDNGFFVGLAFNHSSIYSNYNVGIRLGYYMGENKNLK